MRGRLCDSQASCLDRYGQSEVTGGRYSTRHEEEEEEEQGEEPCDEEDRQEMETEETTEARKRQFHFFLQLVAHLH